MKKLLSFMLMFFFIGGVINAQESTFAKGDKVVNLGIGLLSGLYTGGGYDSKTPPISVSVEYGVKDDVLDIGSIGIGGYLGSAEKLKEPSFNLEYFG